MGGFVYILASRRHGTLYTGCTSDLSRRVQEHRDELIPGFTERYGVKRLVHIESFDAIDDAILRERRIKEWKRAWKIQLVEQHNPLWDDLAVSLLGFEPLASDCGSGVERGIDGFAVHGFLVEKSPFRHPGENRDL